jgi:hypothetical protein
MEMYYIVTDIPRWLLCERVVKLDNGYWLYKFDESNAYTDSGYAEDLEDLKFLISARYDWRRLGLFLARSFEEVAKMFDSSWPRIIHLAMADIFCVKRGDVLFSVKWDYDAEDRFFVKKMEWGLGSSPPRSLKDALERLSDYAKKRGVWIVLRETIKEATAYEVYP